jgi:deoxyribodipyrimidine photolyase-related protein
VTTKRIILILGDQLDEAHPALSDYNADTDMILMIESSVEANYVWSHKARIAIFLSAMRHYARKLSKSGYAVKYIKESELSLIEAIRIEIKQYQATHLIFVTPGEFRLKIELQTLAKEFSIELSVLEDTHFYCSLEEFKAWVGSKKELRLEYFYRYMRKKNGILMNHDGTPVGGDWNFDDQNRRPFPKQGPGLIPPPIFFEQDSITKDVIAYVESKYADHPGSIEQFRWAVTREQALEALHYFVRHRLGNFGMFQDAMWKQTPYGWHSILSAALNLKLLNPREVISEVLKAYQDNALDLATVEGFIRQIIGWREFVRGIYYLDMPNLAEQNFYEHERALPEWYWSGETKMNCMKDAIGQTLDYGYAHHIQRLMVTGNFALLAEILPKAVSDWYLAVYVDAIEWVEMPNVLGMALFANGGRFTSKPYIASGAYINRMSNYCQGCAYQPSVKSGDGACPMTTLYWNFLLKHQSSLEKNPRTRLMTVNLKRFSEQEKADIKAQANFVLSNLEAL